MTDLLVTLEDRWRVLELAHHLYDWIPPLPSPEQRRAVAGFEHGPRDQACPDCLANDLFAGGVPGCETCGGSGRIPAGGDRDPYERRATAVFDQAALARRDQSNAQVAAIARIQQLIDEHDGKAVREGWLDRAVRMKEAQQRRAPAFAQLERALELLAFHNYPLQIAFLFYEVEQQFPVPDDRIRGALDRAADWLAGWMRRPILLPAEAERDLEAWKHALQHGKTDAHRRARAQRDAQLRDLRHVEGWSLRRIAAAFGLTPEGVRLIVDVQTMPTPVATAASIEAA